MILLSILIPSTYDRMEMTNNLVNHISSQVIGEVNISESDFYYGMVDSRLRVITSSEVEIIVYFDNKIISTGNKREYLYQMASGIYSISTDSDDWVPSYYVCELLEAAKSDADCFGINGHMITDGSKIETWDISKDNPYKTLRTNLGNHYKRYPNHITGIKSEICKQFKFPDTTFGEDFDWATQIHNSGLIKSEFTITKPMYEYRYSSTK